MTERGGVIVSVGDLPLMELESVEAVPPGLAPLGGRSRLLVGELLDLGLKLGAASGQTTSSRGTYRVVMSADLQAGLDSGAFKMVNLQGKGGIMVRDARTGRFVGSGHLEPAEAAKLVRATAAAWQVAALVTQQHFLAEIDVKLGSIVRGIQDLQRFLDSERRAALEAVHEQLRRDRDVVLDTDDDRDRQQLSRSAHDALREAHQHAKMGVLQLQTLHEDVTSKAAPDTWAQAQAEADIVVYALGVCAEALASTTLAGESPARQARGAQDLAHTLGRFREVMEHLIGYFQQELGAHPPAAVSPDPLWKEVLKSNPPYLIARGISRHLANRRHGHWKAMADQVVSTGRAALARADDVGEALVKIADGAGGRALTLYADVDEAGVVQQVYRVPEPGMDGEGAAPA